MEDTLNTRSIHPNAPKTFDEESRSVRVVAVTENPVQVWDWKTNGFVNEVLLIDGFRMRPNGRIPLLDAHNRNSVDRILGSATDFQRIGDRLECRVYFSSTEAGENAARNVRDGHLTDFSVGYQPTRFEFIPAGTERTINGAAYKGPVKVTTEWTLKELSVTPIGADHWATARSWGESVPLKTEPESSSPPPVAAGTELAPPASAYAPMLPDDPMDPAAWPDETPRGAAPEPQPPWMGKPDTPPEGTTDPPQARQATGYPRSRDAGDVQVRNALIPFEGGGRERKREETPMNIVDILFYGLLIYMAAMLLCGIFL